MPMELYEVLKSARIVPVIFSTVVQRSSIRTERSCDDNAAIRIERSSLASETDRTE